MSGVLVIGSNSFSGASFVRHLLQQGIDVIGASRSPSLHPYFYPTSGCPLSNVLGFGFCSSI